MLCDPADLFNSRDEKTVDLILSGRLIHLGIKTHNHRNIKKILIEKMPKNNDVLILGPSLVMGISKSDTGAEKTYNLGVGGADLNDVLAQLALLEINKVNSKKMIFCIDSFLFDQNLYNNSQLNKELMPYSKYMLKLLNGEKNIQEPNLSDVKFAHRIIALKNLFSISYFQSALTYLRRIIYRAIISKEEVNNSYLSIEETNKINADNRKNINGLAYYTDASIIYPLKYEKRTIDFVLKDIEKRHAQKSHFGFTDNAHISNFSKDTFEKVIKYYKAKGVKIEFFICPLPPSYWDILQQYNFPILKEEEEFAHYIAKKYNIPTTGSINPYKVGIKDVDFYDARHVRNDVLSKYFNFKY